MSEYQINVRYRTASGCNAKLVKVEADSPEEAFSLASRKVRGQRGVTKIDGGDWLTPSADTLAERWAEAQRMGPPHDWKPEPATVAPGPLTADEWLTVIYALQDYGAEYETGPARVETILAKLPSEDALCAEAWRAEGYAIAPDGALTPIGGK